MKKLITIILIVCTSFAFKSDTDFCNGWKSGYVEGWCYNDPNCLKPIVPVCPVPLINQKEYKHGYNRGFVTGKKDRREF